MQTRCKLKWNAYEALDQTLTVGMSYPVKIEYEWRGTIIPNSEITVDFDVTGPSCVVSPNSVTFTTAEGGNVQTKTVHVQFTDVLKGSCVTITPAAGMGSCVVSPNCTGLVEYTIEGRQVQRREMGAPHAAPPLPTIRPNGLFDNDVNETQFKPDQEGSRGLPEFVDRDALAR